MKSLGAFDRFFSFPFFLIFFFIFGGVCTGQRWAKDALGYTETSEEAAMSREKPLMLGFSSEKPAAVLT